MRHHVIVGALAGVLLLGGCSAGGDPAGSASPTASTAASRSPSPAPGRTSARPTASTTASPVDTATPDPSTSPTAAPITPLVDYGALLSVWASRHTADERFDPGAMWDPTPGWGPDEDNNDKFNDVVLTGGRVLDYVLYLPRPSVTAAKATAVALTALPRDAAVLWTRQFAACSVVQLRSASLAKVLAAKPFANPDGQVQLVLRSGTGTAPAAAFDPAKVASVLVRDAVAASPSDFTGC
jgi:hypothetical protein